MMIISMAVSLFVSFGAGTAEAQINLDALNSSIDSVFTSRQSLLDSKLKTENSLDQFNEERFAGLQVDTMLLKSWITQNSSEFWTEMERLNSRVIEQQSGLTDLVYFLEYEKQKEALDSYSLALEYIQDLADVEGRLL
eukprot:GHVH01017441.1.p1 GENE.GHVH01017441.1~~GHVH01017441.1.p1  ORF type:complete len:138 (-),score=22.25 GHVH01017441.1:1165-1578(-)